MKNTIWIIVSALIGLLSPTYCGAENIAPGKSQVDTLSHKSRQIITIQVGSYKKVEDAERDMTRLKGLGLDAFKDYELVKDKGMWHRLYIGSFESTNAATEYANELVDKGVISGFWVKKKNVPVEIEKQPATDQHEIQAPVAGIQSPETETEVTSNEIPAATIHTEALSPPTQPEALKSKEADIPDDELVLTEPVIRREETHSRSMGKSENGKRKSGISLGLKSSLLYANNVDDFKITRFSNTTGEYSWNLNNPYVFVGLVGNFKVYEGWSIESSLEKDISENIDIWQFLIGPKYEFRQIGFITPFVRAGVVLGRLKLDDAPGSFDTGIGFDAGFGVVLIKSNFQLGLETSLQRLRYTYNKPSDIEISSTEDYIDMSGIVFSGTVSYLF